MSIKMPAHVASFSTQYGINPKLFERFADYFNQYRVENKLTTKALSYTTTTTKEDGTTAPISFTEKEVQLNALMLEEIAKLANMPQLKGFASEVIVTNPNYNWAAFAIVNAMIDMIIPDTLLDSIGVYTGIRTGGLTDSFSYNIKSNDLFVVTKAGLGGKRKSEVHKQFEGQVTLIPKERDITVGVSLYRVLAGEESLAEFVMKATRSMETQMTIDAYNAFDTAMSALPNTVGSGLRVAGYSQDAIVNLAEVVGSYNNGAKPVFLGTQIALSKIVPSDTNYRIQIDSDYVKFGYVKTAFGYDALVMNQKADWKTKFKTLLKNDRVYIVSPSAQKLIQLAIGGATTSITTGVYENADLSQSTTLKKRWETGVATNATAAIITLS